MKNNIYAVCLTATSNEQLSEQLDSGESIEGMLEINETAGEFYFTSGACIAFSYEDYHKEDDCTVFSNGTEYYKFSHKPLETVKR